MKYKLLKDLPGYNVGYIFEDNTWYPFDSFNKKAYPDFFEEVKEPKTIYDLEDGNEYFAINYPNKIIKYEAVQGNFADDTHTYCFLTEREAKRNKLLRELATRQDKWLPIRNTNYYSYHLTGCDSWNWQGDNTDMVKYHMGLVFRNEKEYNKYLTEEAKDLLFNI